MRREERCWRRLAVAVSVAMAVCTVSASVAVADDECYGDVRISGTGNSLVNGNYSFAFMHGGWPLFRHLYTISPTRQSEVEIDAENGWCCQIDYEQQDPWGYVLYVFKNASGSATPPRTGWVLESHEEHGSPDSFVVDTPRMSGGEPCTPPNFLITGLGPDGAFLDRPLASPEGDEPSMFGLQDLWYSPVGEADTGSYYTWLSYNSDYGYHLALDLQASAGDSVYAITSGVVLYRDPSVPGYGPNGTPGGVVVVLHETLDGTAFKALYGHLDEIPLKGAPIAPGQQIGVVNGFSPPHVHFGIHLGANPPTDGKIFRGYTDEVDTTYGWVNPFSFLNSHSPDTLVDIYNVGDLVTGACSIEDEVGSTVRGISIQVYIYSVDIESRPQVKTLLDHWGNIQYDGNRGGYSYSWDTNGYTPGYYDVHLSFGDGSSRTSRIQLIAPTG